MKRTLLFTAIASISAINVAMADTVVTSKTYVDNRDNLKVNIAQGVGTNNANVGKTLVVNQQGNLELGTPSAGNYVEDSITDGVTNKAPSENAVHDALADKQDLIDTDMVEIEVADKHGGTQTVYLPALVSYDSGNDGLTGDYFGVWTTDASMPINGVADEDLDKIIPTFGLVTEQVGEWLDANHMTCAGWPDGVAHTDENCWLWYKN